MLQKVIVQTHIFMQFKSKKQFIIIIYIYNRFIYKYMLLVLLCIDKIQSFCFYNVFYIYGSKMISRFFNLYILAKWK